MKGTFVALAAVATSVHASDCPAGGEKECGRGQFYNELACLCFYAAQCKIGCPEGEVLDPRETCECVDKDVVKALFPADLSQ